MLYMNINDCHFNPWYIINLHIVVILTQLWICFMYAIKISKSKRWSIESNVIDIENICVFQCGDRKSRVSFRKYSLSFYDFIHNHFMLINVYKNPLRWPRTYYLYRLSLIPAWISNYIQHKVWDEITWPFPNFNGGTVSEFHRYSAANVPAISQRNATI